MTTSSARPTRVLIVEDSSTTRMLLRRAFAGDPRFEVVAALSSAEEAWDQLPMLAPDVMTLDIELPGMSGIELLRRLRPVRPVPTVVVSARGGKGARESLEALEAGAVDVVEKPGGGTTPESMLSELRTKVAIAATARLGRLKAPMPLGPVSTASSATGRSAGRGLELIALGASTGGPAAVEQVLAALVPPMPPVVVVLHMPAGFTNTYAARLNDRCRLEVAEAVDGELLRPGRVLIAPGGRQFRMRRQNGALAVVLGETTRHGGHAPSVDVLFESVAATAGRNAIGAIFTGMGADGAAGLLSLRKAGGRTLAQDEASCVVFGMPKAAWELGAAEELVPLEQIASRLTTLPAAPRLTR